MRLRNEEKDLWVIFFKDEREKLLEIGDYDRLTSLKWNEIILLFF